MRGIMKPIIDVTYADLQVSLKGHIVHVILVNLSQCSWDAEISLGLATLAFFDETGIVAQWITIYLTLLVLFSFYTIIATILLNKF